MSIRNADLVKFSHKRLVVSGESFELYVYEKPFSYNWPPMTRNTGARASARAKPRRADNLANSRRRIQRLIEANMYAYGQVPKFITYTFAENVTNLDDANRAWNVYMSKMRPAFGKLKYLVVVEFQKRGAVHFHVVFFNLGYVKNIKRRFQKMWGNGWVKVIALGHVQSVGRYVAKYLTEDTHDERLIGRKAYFTSRGLAQPEEFRNEDNVEQWTEEHWGDIVDAETSKTWPSERFGRVLFKKGKIKKICR